MEDDCLGGLRRLNWRYLGCADLLLGWLFRQSLAAPPLGGAPLGGGEMSQLSAIKTPKQRRFSFVVVFSYD